MQGGLDIGKSLVVHGLVVTVAWFGLPQLGRDLAVDQPVLTVDIVDTVPETNLDEGIDAILDAAEEADAAEDEPPPPPPPPPPSDSRAEPVPAPEAVPAPDNPQRKPEAEDQQLAKVSAPPRRPSRRSPLTSKQREQQAQLTSKLQDLTHRSERQRRRERDDEEDKQKDAEKDEAREKLDQLVGQALNTPSRRSGELGVSDIDRLRSHIATCWNPPPGAAQADHLNVDIIMRFDANGNVLSIEFKDRARYNRDQSYKSAAQAAGRALFECSPLPLPKEWLETNNSLEFGFDPSFITRR